MLRDNIIQQLAEFDFTAPVTVQTIIEDDEDLVIKSEIPEQNNLSADCDPQTSVNITNVTSSTTIYQANVNSIENQTTNSCVKRKAKDNTQIPIGWHGSSEKNTSHAFNNVINPDFNEATRSKIRRCVTNPTQWQTKHSTLIQLLSRRENTFDNLPSKIVNVQNQSMELQSNKQQQDNMCIYTGGLPGKEISINIKPEIFQKHISVLSHSSKQQLVKNNLHNKNIIDPVNLQPPENPRKNVRITENQDLIVPQETVNKTFIVPQSKILAPSIRNCSPYLNLNEPHSFPHELKQQNIKISNEKKISTMIKNACNQGLQLPQIAKGNVASKAQLPLQHVNTELVSRENIDSYSLLQTNVTGQNNQIKLSPRQQNIESYTSRIAYNCNYGSPQIINPNISEQVNQQNVNHLQKKHNETFRQPTEYGYHSTNAQINGNGLIQPLKVADMNIAVQEMSQNTRSKFTESGNTKISQTVIHNVNHSIANNLQTPNMAPTNLQTIKNNNLLHSHMPRNDVIQYTYQQLNAFLQQKRETAQKNTLSFNSNNLQMNDVDKIRQKNLTSRIIPTQSAQINTGHGNSNTEFMRQYNQQNIIPLERKNNSVIEKDGRSCNAMHLQVSETIWQINQHRGAALHKVHNNSKIDLNAQRQQQTLPDYYHQTYRSTITPTTNFCRLQNYLQPMPKTITEISNHNANFNTNEIPLLQEKNIFHNHHAPSIINQTQILPLPSLEPSSKHMSSLEHKIEEHQNGAEVSRSLSTDSGFISPLNFNTLNDYEQTYTTSHEEEITPNVANATSINPHITYIREGRCHVCGTKTQTKCLGCLNIYYCNNNCQAADWLTHRTVCRAGNLQGYRRTTNL